MEPKQVLIEVDLPIAQAFFDAGGTIHMVRMNFGMHAGHTATKEDFDSVKHALAAARGQLGGSWLPAIDKGDPHPANPLNRQLGAAPAAEPYVYAIVARDEHGFKFAERGDGGWKFYPTLDEARAVLAGRSKIDGDKIVRGYDSGGEIVVTEWLDGETWKSW